MSGWLLDEQLLAGGDEPIRFNNGLCLFLSGLSLALINSSQLTGLKKIIAHLASWLVMVIGSLTLCQYFTGWNAHIDELFTAEGGKNSPAGRMSVFAAINITLIGISLLLLLNKKYPRLAQIFTFLTFPGSVISILNTTNTGFLEKWLQFFSTALPAAIIYLLLGIGILSSQPLKSLKFSFEKKVGIFFLVVCITLGVIFFAFNKNNQHSADTSKWLDHTNQVLLQSNEILSKLQDIQSGTRGYVITGSDNYLEEYYQAAGSIESSLLVLKKLTSDNSIQQTRIYNLQILLKEIIRYRDHTIETRRESGLDEAIKIIVEGTGKKLTEKARALVNSIQDDEKKLLKNRRAENDLTIKNSSRVLFILQVLLVLLLLSGFLVISHNTIRRNQAEKAIRKLNATLENRVEEKTKLVIEKEKQYRFLLENMQEGIQVIDHDWRYVFVNNSAVHQSKLTATELIGHTLMETYPGIEHTELFEVLQDSMTKRVQNIYDNEYRYPDGTTEYFELSIQPVPEGLFILSMNITERKLAEEKLIKTHADLELSNKELEQFAYVASHDLQEPLRMVSSFLTLVERKLEGQLTETTKKYIDFAIDGAERMKMLIQALLEYSRVGSDKKDFSLTDMNELIDYSLRVLSEEIKKTGAVIETQRLPSFFVNKDLIGRLFLNLIGNAIKYRNEVVPHILIGYEEKSHEYIFHVKDNGIGIDAKDFEMIFIIFQRLHSKSAYQGTGIGLAISKKIVETHSGRIWVESVPGSGSSFYFSIPKQS